MKKLKISLLSTPGSPLLGYMLKSLTQNNIDIHSVIMDSKGMEEKDLKLWEERTSQKLPPVPLHFFEKENIPFYFHLNHSSENTSEFVRSEKIDILVNAGTPRILKKNIISAPSLGILNCHPGLLPAFRGCTCVEWAIYLDEEIGNTVHFMTEKIDEGPVVLKEGLLFKKSDSYSDIRVKVYKHGFELMAQAICILQQQGASIIDSDYRRDGRYFDVIGQDKFHEVYEKTTSGLYAFQK